MGFQCLLAWLNSRGEDETFLYYELAIGVIFRDMPPEGVR